MSFYTNIIFHSGRLKFLALKFVYVWVFSSIKMHQEKLNINWQTYYDHLREMLHSMRQSDYLTDVTLVCDDKKQIEAHNTVLGASSGEF